MGLVAFVQLSLAGISEESQHDARLLCTQMQTCQANMFKGLVFAPFWLELFRVSMSRSKRAEG